MKRFLTLALALCICIMVPMTGVYAEEIVGEDIEYLADGSYFITRIVSVDSRAASTKSGAKVKTYYDSEGTKLFTLKVHGTFRYDGSTVTCIDASYTYEIFDSAWSLKSATASKSGATATASGTFVKKILGITMNTKTLTPTLTCDKNGNLS